MLLVCEPRVKVHPNKGYENEEAAGTCASSAAITGGDAVTVTDELGEESASFSTDAVLNSGAPRPVQA